MGLLIDPLLNNFNLALHVGSSIFVHGGLTKKHLVTGGGSIGKMNAQAKVRQSDIASFLSSLPSLTHRCIIQEWLNTDFKGDAKMMRQTLPDGLGGGVASQVSPVWMRDYSKPSGGGVSGQASFKLNELFDYITKTEKENGNENFDEPKRIFVGHTPQKKINSVLDGRIWRIDTGVSSGVARGIAEVVQIEHMAMDDGSDRVKVLSEVDGVVDGVEREVFVVDF